MRRDQLDDIGEISVRAPQASLAPRRGMRSTFDSRLGSQSGGDVATFLDAETLFVRRT